VKESNEILSGGLMGLKTREEESLQLVRLCCHRCHRSPRPGSQLHWLWWKDGSRSSWRCSGGCYVDVPYSGDQALTLVQVPDRSTSSGSYCADRVCWSAMPQPHSRHPRKSSSPAFSSFERSSGEHG
jgi:hypothetical protein